MGIDRRDSRLDVPSDPRYETPVVFIHINKTGGSSIEQALKLAFEHKTAEEKRGELGPRLWARAFKFTFVRNPWDKVVSHYSYRVETNQTGMGDGHISFRDWVLLAYGARDPRYYDHPKMFMPQSDWICDDDGTVLVDFVGRFESLDGDFQRVCERLKAFGRTAAVNRLPHVKRSPRGPYREYYDDETMKVVQAHFAADLVRFEYSWGNVRSPSS